MTEQEAANVEALKRAYSQWNDTKGDPYAAWDPLLADDFQYHSLGAGREGIEFTKDYGSKKDLFLEFFVGLNKDWQMEFYRIDEYFAQGDKVVALGHTLWHNRRTGKPIDTPKADVWTFRDGKAVTFMEFMDTAMMADAAKE